MVAAVGKCQRMAGKGASCAVKPLDLYHGSFHPNRLIESVQVLLEGTHSQKIQVLYAKSNAWIMPLMISRSGESLGPLINVMRTATLSMNHTPRLSRNWCGLQTNAWKITTISSCAILRSPGSHRSYTSCGKSAMKASLVAPGLFIQTIQNPRRAPLAPKNAYLSKLLAYRKKLYVMPPCFQVAPLALLC